ncbi:MAG TPA: hypothetical protein VHX68_20115 [Planctomycetaceae bacterium]|jgi:hypothetical protein|nr:hypothetical protein [Planctomycetaceae bacterium]
MRAGKSLSVSSADIRRRKRSQPCSFDFPANGFIRFLNVIEKQVPVGKTIHAVVDNYAAP